MKFLAKYLFFGTIYIGLFSATFLTQTSPASAAEKDKTEAQKLWDEVIKMKGGRDRLRNVHSLLATFSYDGKTPQLSELFIFPNKYWKWIKDGPRPRGTDPMPTMTLCNGSIRKNYHIATDVVLLHENEDCQYEIDENNFLLLESATRPFEPVRVTRGRFGKKIVDIIETRFHKHRIDFTVEVESLMVLKVSDYGEDFETDSRASEYVFENYVDIDGIKMPLKKGWLEFGEKKPKVRSWVYYTYQFNVDYDPKLFVGSPSLVPALDAWKPGAAKPSTQKIYEYRKWEQNGYRPY
jgi:hypothetical protein